MNAKLKIVEINRSMKCGNAYSFRTVYWDGNVVGQLDVEYSCGKIWKYLFVDEHGAVIYAYVNDPGGWESDGSRTGWQFDEFPELTFSTARAALADLKKRIIELSRAGE